MSSAVGSPVESSASSVRALVSGAISVGQELKSVKIDAPDKILCGGKLISLPVTNVPRIRQTGKLISLPPQSFVAVPRFSAHPH